METLMLFLLLLAAVLLSAVLDQVIPRMSLPLVQIAIGVLIALLMHEQINISLNPDVFIIAIIVPLLYDEAKNMDNAMLWRYRKPVMILAVGLVVASTVLVGFAVHFLIPFIPLAAAFALGAALGPTDAVAVASLSGSISIPDRQNRILQGESMMNDATGVVAFQFALAAIMTGAFSPVGAVGSFVVAFFGGMLGGALCALIARFVLVQAQRVDVDNTTFHILFEMFVPFIIYIVCTAVGVNGIIAVVVAGLLNVTVTKDAGPHVSRMNIVSGNVWRVLSFALNGVVFILLGTQLPRAMSYTWENLAFNNTMLILYVVALSVLLYLIRFVWLIIQDALENRHAAEPMSRKELFHYSLVGTLSGAKGAITMTVMLTIPFALPTGELFPQRDLLIFLACGVIVVTMLVATFVVPLLAPKQEEDVEERAEGEMKHVVDMLSDVMVRLTAMQTPENRMAVERALHQYSARIAKIVETHDLESDIERPCSNSLKVQVIHWQRDLVEARVEAGEVDPDVALRYLRRLDRAEGLLSNMKLDEMLDNWQLRARLLIRQTSAALHHRLPVDLIPGDYDEEMRTLRMGAYEYTLDKLTSTLQDPAHPSAEASALISHYQSMLNGLKSRRLSIGDITRAENDTNEILSIGYRMELERIHQLCAEGSISRETAKHLRTSVTLMSMDAEGVI